MTKERPTEKKKNARRNCSAGKPRRNIPRERKGRSRESSNFFLRTPNRELVDKTTIILNFGVFSLVFRLSNYRSFLVDTSVNSIQVKKKSKKKKMMFESVKSIYRRIVSIVRVCPLIPSILGPATLHHEN